MNANVATATVEDWTGKELARFEGRNSASNAIEWRERTADTYATEDNGRKMDTDSTEYEERYSGALEDLYVIGYDEKGNKTGVEFG